ncbi:unnamed protein product, partial [Laminaria digitata]
QYGKTLRSRFAAISGGKGIERRETRSNGRVLVGRKANLEERSGDGGTTCKISFARHESIPHPSRFRRAGRQIIRQCLETRLKATPDDKRVLTRLGNLALADGDLDEAVYYLHCAAKGSRDDGVWVALARAEVRAWERDPAVGHDHLRMACDAHRRSIDLIQTGFVEAWELSARLLELGGVYEAFGAFEGALSIYQRIASSMAPSPGFEDVLFRCAVVMRYMASLENSPRERLLHSAMEHLSLAIQGQTTRQSRPADSAMLFYADVCMLLAEGSEEARKWAGTSYHEVFEHRTERGDPLVMGFRSWDDWIASPQTQLQLAREWARKGEPTLAAFAFQKASKAFEREKDISPVSTTGPSFADLMDMAETYSSFQRFERHEEREAEEAVREAAALDPESVEARDFLRCLLGNENCRRKEMRIQVALHLQSKWRTRVWCGQYLASLKKKLQQDLEERLRKNRMDVQAREQLSYFFQEKHRPVLLFEDRCAKIIQRLGRVGLFRLRQACTKKIKQKAYRKHLAAALKRWQKNCWAAEARETVRARARSQYTPRTHKIVSVVALMDRQDGAAPSIQRTARARLARNLFFRMLEIRSRDVRQQVSFSACSGPERFSGPTW